jgi:hypothetical protein
VIYFTKMENKQDSLSAHTIMKYIVTISGFFLAVTVCCLPAFSDTLLLKSGKSLEGKIIDETDTYVTIEYAGVPLKYWKEEIQEITKSQPVSQPTTSPVASQPFSQPAPIKTATIVIKQDNKQEIAAFVKKIEVLRDDITTSLNAIQDKIGEDVSIDKRVTDEERQSWKETVETVRKKLEQAKLANVPSECRDLRDSALRISEAELERFSSQLNSFITYADLKNYWEQYPKEKLGELKKKYDIERERILRVYNIKAPGV